MPCQNAFHSVFLLSSPALQENGKYASHVQPELASDSKEEHTLTFSSAVIGVLALAAVVGGAYGCYVKKAFKRLNGKNDVHNNQASIVDEETAL
jgi:hypothetical protein